MKRFLLHLFSISFLLLVTKLASGQSVYRFSPLQKNVLIDEVVEFSSPSPAISSTLPPAILALNFHINDQNEAGGILLKFNERTECTQSILLKVKDGNIQLKDQIQVGADLIVLANYFSKVNQNTGVFIARINMETKLVIWSHLFGSGHPIDTYSAADMYYSRGFLYVLANRSTLVGPTSRDRMSIWKLSENGELSFSLTINNDNVGDVDFGTSITITPDNNILAAGLSTPINNSVGKILLCKLSLSGQLKLSRDLVFKDVNGRVQRPDFPFLDINAGNIHLACQAVLGRSDQGMILITMLDSDLNLRTWRDYSPKIHMEDFKIGGGKFLLSGQDPVTNGGTGYGMVGINNLNAIPEIIDYYRSGFESVSIATSSSIVYHNAWQQYLMAARPNKSSESFVNIVERKNDLNGSCAEPFTFSVTKDEVTVNDIGVLHADSLMLGKEPFNFDLTDINFARETICLKTGINENSEAEFILSPNPAKRYLNVTHDFENWQDSKIYIYDLFGRVIFVQSLQSESESLDISSLEKGLYLVSIQDEKFRKKVVKRFLKMD